MMVEVLDLVASWRNGSASGFDRQCRVGGCRRGCGASRARGLLPQRLRVRALRWSSSLILIREEKTIRHSEYSAATTVKEIRNRGEVGLGTKDGVQWI